MNFLEHQFLHVSHSLVVRILANVAGGPGSNPCGVTCGMGEEGQLKLWVMHGVTKCVVDIEFIDCLQSKMSFQFIEISINIS
jgi:hypothetical protein